MPGEGPGQLRKGRGAVIDPPGRFEPRRVVALDDGWGELPPPAVATTVTPEPARTILSTNDSPDVPFDRSINPYKGCEHGCVYCFARPTHAYLGLSPGIDFETRIFSKPNAPELLRQELGRARYRCAVIALGANTDPYQPAERRLGLTRGILEVLAAHRHPVSVVTKSNLVLRDLDLLGPMAADGLALVLVSITTLDRELARKMEPRAPTPERRLEALGALAEARVPTGVLASPMIPGLNDHELERILEASARAGASFAGYVLVRLPHEVRELFSAWLEAHYPGRAGRVLKLIRETHEGRLYDPSFHRRMRGTGPYAMLLRRRFEVATSRLGLGHEPPPLDVTRFRVPGRSAGQGSLFRWPA
jgi:DNA repair photolyase